MRIPRNITRLHILAALKEIDKNGFDSRHKAKKWYLKYDGKSYPVKYPIYLANKYVDNTELSFNPNIFNTQIAIKTLKELGFSSIEKCLPK